MVLTWRLTNTGPGSMSHEGTEPPKLDFLWNARKRSWGVSLVALHKSDRTKCRASRRTSCHRFGGNPQLLRAIVIAFQIVQLYFSTWPFPAGLKLVVRLAQTPFERRKSRRSRLINAAPRSECTKAGIPQIENKVVRHLITVCADTSAQGNTNGNREYSSTTWRKYTFLSTDGRGPLKSNDSLSNGFVALMSRPLSGRKKRGLHSLQMRHSLVTRLTSSVE